MNKRFALCVGNNYPGTNAELKGCKNDALDWAELLRREKYDVVLLNEATKDQVISNLSDLVAQTGFGDRVVFTYSGHGTWVPDRDGDEADQRDEAMVMAGLSWEDLLLDDDLQKIFGNLKRGSSGLVLSDSCHSGTISRFVNPTPRHRSEAVLTPPKPRFLSPAEIPDAPISFEKVVELERNDTRSVPRRSASLISGCGDLEYSYDASFNGRPNGAFTRAAIDMFMSGISLNHWFQAIRQMLPDKEGRYPQTPQLTTTSYRKYTRAI